VHESPRIHDVVSGRTVPRNLGLHRCREFSQRPSANSGDQVGEIGEMPVRRVGRDTDSPGSLA
jgi:hypothetical protein